ncbi:radial spoke head 10 homolog B-like [Battus philenor]|uniref:radial spoke head 10 homolog B-like n=1 Tax=Battus philenor TaxID=42288 RepID=UPI0035CF6BD9
MRYVDSPRNITRRDSSLILTKRSISEVKSYGGNFMTSIQSLTSESTTYMINRPKGTVQKEVITFLFNSMLDCIVETWDVTSKVRKEDSSINKDFRKISSATYQKRKKSLGKPSKLKKSRNEFLDETQVDELLPISWWSSPDEQATIRFKNGNIYEGNISMKVMHGDGIFMWADGTVYTGKFKDNEMNGRGLIQWKDDTWYEGEFVGNLRHGKGMYVDSRNQRSYIGQWYNGTKNGHGVIYYSQTFKNSYEGQWLYNVRHGFGSREYCPHSGYEGNWDLYVREGKGLMIWPNHDFYRGYWKNGVMSGTGTYIWDTFHNDSMSQPSVIMYQGQWFRGQRHGYGMLNLGLSLGAYYSGEFKNNQKHGAGMLVSNNGFILQSKQLFRDGNLDTSAEDAESTTTMMKHEQVLEPYKFDIIDNSIGLSYHVKEAIKNIDKQKEIRTLIINKFIESNKKLYGDVSLSENEEIINDNVPDDLIYFELRSLRKSLRCYESDLKRIYYKYCTVCNSKEISFTPVLIRLYLWQMYYDCNIHEKGMTLVEIDNIFSQNPKWLASSPHDPFEPIFFWQFIHSLISVANKLYAKKELPGPKPDTILASAFRTFMDKDILPGVTLQKGRLVHGYGDFIPLKSLYKLYLNLGEPHTLLTYLRAIRLPPHSQNEGELEPIEAATKHPLGRNVYVFGDEITYIFSKYNTYIYTPEYTKAQKCNELKLCNFRNLSNKSIIAIFSLIFPQVCEENTIKNLNVEIIFLEFFEIFIACALKCVSIGESELPKSYADIGTVAPPQTPIEF